MRFLPALLAAALLAGIPAGAATAAETQDGSVGIRLVDTSSGALDDPRAKSYIVEHLAPGTGIERNVEILNQSREAMKVSVYAGAADIVDGQFTVAEEGVKSDLSSWTSVPSPTLSIEPGKSAMVPVSIDVPADAGEGEQYGVVWAQIQDAEGSTLNVSRVGVREYISVGPGNGPAAGFTVAELKASRTEAGAPVVEAIVTNTGGRALDVTGSLALANGPAGISAGPFKIAKTVTIAPGGSAPVAVQLDAALPTGPWDATLTLASGTLSVDTSGSVNFPDLVEVTVDAPAESSSAWMIFAGAGALLLAAATALLIFKRRRA